MAGIGTLIEDLNDSGKKVRLGALNELVKIGKPAVPQLIGLLSAPRCYMRSRAVKALVEIGKPAVPALIEALKAGNQHVRSSAAVALGKIGVSTKQLGTIIKMLKKGKTSDERAGAAGALGKIGDGDAVSSLVEALKDNKAQVREEAAKALGWIGTIPVLPPLAKSLKDRNFQVRAGAAWALLMVANKHPGYDMEASAAALIKTSDDEHPEVRLWTALALATIAKKHPEYDMGTAVPVFIETLKCLPLSVQQKVRDVLEGIIMGRKKVEELVMIKVELAAAVKEARDTREYPLIKIIETELLEIINKRKDQLLSIEITVDDRKIKAPRKSPKDGRGYQQPRVIRNG